MRGRTNVTQRSGSAPVNGDVKECVVESGNKISIGDFVSYVPAKDEYYISDDGSLLSNMTPVKIGSYFLYLSNNKLYAFSLVNGVMVLSRKYDTYVLTEMAIYNNYIFCIARNGTSSTNYTYSIIKLKFENGNFEKVNDVNLTGRYVWGISVNSNYNYVIAIGFENRKRGTTSYYDPYFHAEVFKIEDMLKIEGFSEVSLGSKYVFALANVCCSNNKIYAFCSGNNSYTPTYTTYCVEVVIDINFVSKTIGIDFIIGTDYARFNSGFSNNCVIPVGIFGSKICYIYKYSNDYLRYLVFDVESLSFSSNKALVSIRSGYIFKGSNYDGFFVLNYYSSDSSNSSPKNTFASVKFNSDTGELVFIGSLGNVFGEVQANGLIIYDNYTIYEIGSIKGSDTKERKLIISKDGTEIHQDVDKDRVKSYSGSSIGFAKTGGSAGETIQVYVPYES